MSREQLIVAIAIVVLVAVVFVLMALSWRRRAARKIGTLAAPPAAQEPPFAVLEGLHVATTIAGRPLDRVVVEPLGFRARGVVAFRPDGVELSLDGGEPAFIPAGSIRSHARASWTIDRGVEEDGLNVLTWTLDGTELDSAFRMRDPQGFDAAAARLIAERTIA